MKIEDIEKVLEELGFELTSHGLGAFGFDTKDFHIEVFNKSETDEGEEAIEIVKNNYDLFAK